MNFFPVARGVGRNLRGFLPRPTGAFEILANLLAARTGCVEVFLRVALDLRSIAPPRRNLVTEFAQFVGQIGLIDGCSKLLRGEEALRLDRTRLAGVELSDIENDGVGVKLWRDIAINRASGVVLKLGGDKLAGGFSWMIAPNAGLCVMFELVKGNEARAQSLLGRFSESSREGVHVVERERWSHPEQSNV